MKNMNNKVYNCKNPNPKQIFDRISRLIAFDLNTHKTSPSIKLINWSMDAAQNRKIIINLISELVVDAGEDLMNAQIK